MLVKIFFHHGDLGFNFMCTSSIMWCHAMQKFVVFHILHLLFIYNVLYWLEILVTLVLSTFISITSHWLLNQVMFCISLFYIYIFVFILWDVEEKLNERFHCMRYCVTLCFFCCCVWWPNTRQLMSMFHIPPTIVLHWKHANMSLHPAWAPWSIT